MVCAYCEFNSYIITCVPCTLITIFLWGLAVAIVNGAVTSIRQSIDITRSTNPIGVDFVHINIEK